MNGFAPHVEVTDPRGLFGHNEPGGLLDALLRDMRLAQNIQIQGERRAGKSSILHCLDRRLRETEPATVPVYVNFRGVPRYTGLREGYAYLLGKVHAETMALHRQQWANGVDLPSTGTHLPPDASCETCVRLLLETPWLDVSSMFTEYIRVLDSCGLRVILLIDEYEHMVNTTFKSIKGSFHPVRDISAEVCTNPRGLPPLTYVIAGRVPWHYYYTEHGSEDFNKTHMIYVIGDIPLDAFGAMWRTCVASLSDADKTVIDASDLKASDIFAFTGGWPAFGKLIGTRMLTTRINAENAFTILFPHFTTIWKALSAEEHRLLGIALQQGLALQAGRTATEFVERGLLTEDDGALRPNGTLWQRFIGEMEQRRPIGRANHGYPAHD